MPRDPPTTDDEQFDSHHILVSKDQLRRSGETVYHHPAGDRTLCGNKGPGDSTLLAMPLADLEAESDGSIRECEHCDNGGTSNAVGDSTFARTLVEMDPDEVGRDAGDREIRTDGGSKYTHPTGEGYIGVNRFDGDLEIHVATIENVDWGVGDTLFAMDDPEGVAIVEDEPDDDHQTVQVTSSNGMATLRLRRSVIGHLDVVDGDDVRIYECDAGGIVLVPRDDDPRVMTDGSGYAGDLTDHHFLLTCGECGVLDSAHSGTRLFHDVRVAYRRAGIHEGLSGDDHRVDVEAVERATTGDGR